MRAFILSSQVVSLPLQSVIQVANFCAPIETLIDQDGGHYKRGYYKGGIIEKMKAVLKEKVRGYPGGRYYERED